MKLFGRAWRGARPPPWPRGLFSASRLRLRSSAAFFAAAASAFFCSPCGLARPSSAAAFSAAARASRLGRGLLLLGLLEDAGAQRLAGAVPGRCRRPSSARRAAPPVRGRGGAASEPSRSDMK